MRTRTPKQNSPLISSAQPQGEGFPAQTSYPQGPSEFFTDTFGTLQRHADASATGLGNGQSVVQMAPAEFLLHPILEIPGRGIIKSNWELLLDAIRAYGALNPADTPGRIAGLRQMQAAAKNWREQVGFRGIDPDTLAQDRRLQGINLISFERRLAGEWEEVLIQNGQPAFSTGELDSDQGFEPAAEPLLTRKVKNRTHIGFFTLGVQVVKEDGQAIPAPAVGSGCKLLDDGSCPNGRNASDYYRVESFDHIDQIGDKAAIRNGIFIKDRVWVHRDHVQVSHMTAPNPTVEMQDKSDPVDFPLFNAAPSIQDVEQNGLGDCWLLAAMGAVVRMNPQHFRNVMKDNLDGTVTVRLYDVNPGPVYVTRDITVKKSIVVRQGTQSAGFAGGALWVSIYEKAYVAAGYHGDSDDRLPIQRGSYGTIEGGFSSRAFKHILGRDADSEDLDADHPDFRGGDLTRLINRVPDPNDDDAMIRQLRPQIGLAGITADELWQIVISGATVSQAWTSVFENEQPRKEDLQRNRAAILAATPPALANQMNTLLDWVRDFVLPGKRGTGQYAPWQISIFQRIAARLDAGRSMTISTGEHVVSGGANNGLAGEHIGKGLAGPHAYVLLDYAPKPLPVLPLAGQLYWLKLRNPWGDVKARNPDAPGPGRTYVNKTWDMDYPAIPFNVSDTDAFGTPDTMSARETDNPEFWIELSDATKRFQHFDFTV